MLEPELKDATFEIFLWVSWLWQAGQLGLRSASEKPTIFSNTLPQSAQRYSYKGMDLPPDSSFSIVVLVQLKAMGCQTNLRIQPPRVEADKIPASTPGGGFILFEVNARKAKVS